MIIITIILKNVITIVNIIVKYSMVIWLIQVKVTISMDQLKLTHVDFYYQDGHKVVEEEIHKLSVAKCYRISMHNHKN